MIGLFFPLFTNIFRIFVSAHVKKKKIILYFNIKTYFSILHNYF